MGKHFWISFLFALIVFLLIRLPLFAQIPAALNRDEAALGYNAYSILQTGKDEYGTLLPVSITSFGDQKLPGYVYTLIPFVAAFGLETWVVRLPSLLAGSSVVLLIGILAAKAAEAFFVSSTQKKSKELFVFFSMLAIAISPWSNHFSRVAYEAHLAMAFFLAGLNFYLAARTAKGYSSKILGTGIFWSLAMFTYHTYHIFLPLLSIGIFFLDKKTMFKTERKSLIGLVIVGLITFSLLWFGGVWSGNAKKSNGISPFHSESLWNSVTLYRGAFPVDLFVKKIFFNTFVESVTRYTSNLATTISGAFFFVHGSEHPDHNPGNVPNIHLFALPSILFAVLTTWEQRKTTASKILLIWLVGAIKGRFIHCCARLVLPSGTNGIYQLGQEDVVVPLSVQRKQRDVSNLPGVLSFAGSSRPIEACDRKNNVFYLVVYFPNTSWPINLDVSTDDSLPKISTMAARASSARIFLF